MRIPDQSDRSCVLPIAGDAPRSLPQREAALALRLRVFGRVQGVGFRPYVARTAQACNLAGWVKNTREGVTIQVEGTPERLAEFRARLTGEVPPGAKIQQIRVREAVAGLEHGFRIVESDCGAGRPQFNGREHQNLLIEITPDLATCSQCRAEFLDPSNRRFGYALLGCTGCGPRFTIQTSVPFDRERTSLACFPLCAECGREYGSSADRRFHAQNMTCAHCGPRVCLNSDEPPAGTSPPDADLAVLVRAAKLLRAGAIVAVKGIGGFHLLCDATSPEAVERLRLRKQRERKPLAVIFVDFEQLEEQALVDNAARAALDDPVAPIVTLRRRQGCQLAKEVAPGLRTVGAMLAYTPLHQELVRQAGRPLVATSANACDEPMPITNAAACGELAEIADAIVLHDRTIVRHADDSVVRVIGGRPVPLRLGRGLAPLRLSLPLDLPPMLATGGHLKAAVALARGREIVLGQHIGDLATAAARRRYRDTVDDLCGLLDVNPTRIVCDLHPDYFTTRFARESGLPVVAIQHHHAHVASCLAEYGETGPALGIAWDGTGHGADGAIWGGEFLRVDGGKYERVGSLWPFPLVGGDRAAREPRRCAAGVCVAAEQWPLAAPQFTEAEQRLLTQAFDSPHRATVCTSAGRLFDAWASLLGVVQRSAYEAEPALRLEELADEQERGEFTVTLVEQPASGLAASDRFYQLDWRPWVAETQRLLRVGTTPATVSACFHNALARSCLEIARRCGLETVALSGGCFQNKLLSERVEDLLTRGGFRVLAHRRVPPGDGGLAVGQLWAAALRDQ